MVSPTLEGVVLGGHILAGFVALFAGAGALATEKGGRRHRQVGRSYVYAMTVVALSSLVLYALDPTFIRLFLAMVAVFSYYFVFSGYRVLSRERPADGPTRIDWTAVGLLGLAGVGLLAMGGWLLVGGVRFGTVMVTFGAIAVLFGLRDVRQFRAAEREPRAWLTDHLTRMLAGYIATVTAFSAVNFTFLPVVARWLWPTAVGVPLIFALVRKYRVDRGASAA